MTAPDGGLVFVTNWLDTGPSTDAIWARVIPGTAPVYTGPTKKTSTKVGTTVLTLVSPKNCVPAGRPDRGEAARQGGQEAPSRGRQGSGVHQGEVGRLPDRRQDARSTTSASSSRRRWSCRPDRGLHAHSSAARALLKTHPGQPAIHRTIRVEVHDLRLELGRGRPACPRCVQSPCVWRRRRLTRSWWYGLDSDSACPITFLVAMPNFDCSQRVSRSDARICLALPSTCASLVPDVLDPDRRVVEPDGVAAHQPQRHELVDLAAAVDDEVRAHARQLVQLGVGDVGRERVARRAVACSVTVTCSTMTFGSFSSAVFSP